MQEMNETGGRPEGVTSDGDEPIRIGGQPDVGHEQGGRRIAVEVGNEYIEPGWTRLDLDESGRATVTNRFEEKESRADGEVDRGRVAGLLDVLSRQDAGALEVGMRPGIPDEPRYRIELFTGEERSQTIEVWRSEAEARADLGRMVEELEAVVREVSREQMVL